MDMAQEPSNASRGARGEPMIEVERLTRYYGPVPAINDVSFTAHKGEIVGFLGPNGAGKTTTMRMLTGYLPPSSGTARIAGHDIVTDSMAARKLIGYLPESTPLYPEMTVSDYLHFMARLRGVKDRGAAVERVMSQVSIDHRADDLIGHLSKGFRQRVGIAQALVHDPKLIILDEPTIGLDPRQIREVRELIAELRGDHTVLLSTHILPEAQQLCDRILIIKRGQIVAEDTTEGLTARLGGGEQVRVGLGRSVPAAEMRAALDKVRGVTEVTGDGDSYTVTVQPATDARAAIAAAVVGNGWPLVELNLSRLTLEDVFLELTASDTAEEAMEAEMVTEEEAD
ncbi:MAG: ABC transporter ATP-binding protein [Anaerolineae bacterium]